MIKYQLSRKDSSYAYVNAMGDPNFGSHSCMAEIVVKMGGPGMGDRYNACLRQRAREMTGGTAMYELLTSLAERLNKSSPLRKEIEEVLVAVDNIVVPS